MLLIVLFAASLFNFLFAGFILRFKFQTKIKFLWHKDLLKKILLIAWPFAVAAIFAKVYAYLDSILLKVFLGDLELGFYSVAYKITFAWQFIPLGLVAALYPAFAHFFKEDKVQLTKVFNRGLLYLSLIAWPLSFGIIVLAPEIISQIYKPEFNSSILPLQILIVSLGFLFMNFALSSLLNSANKQKINTRNLGFTMVFNIILNLILIPLVGVWGAALASSTSTLFLFILTILSGVILIFRFKWVGLAFVLLYESFNIYLFGDRFLAEGVIVYPIVYLAGLFWEKIQKRKIYKMEYALTGVIAWLVVFMREPYIPLILFLFFLILWGEDHRREKIISIAIFLSLTFMFVLIHPINEFIFNVFTMNFQNISTEFNETGTRGLGFFKIFLYPFVVLFKAKWNDVWLVINVLVFILIILSAKFFRVKKDEEIIHRRLKF